MMNKFNKQQIGLVMYVEDLFLPPSTYMLFYILVK